MAYTGYERYSAENQASARSSASNEQSNDMARRANRAAIKQARRDNKTKMEGYINAMPDGFTAESLPNKYQPNIEKFLHAGKERYANAAMEIQQYEPGTEEYQFYKDEMSSVTNSFKTAKTQVDMFGSQKKDMAIDLSNGTYSEGNDIGEMGTLTSVYTDQYDMIFNDNGTIGFDDGAGGVTNFNELPDYFNKDFKTGDAIQAMATKLYGKGVAFDESTRQTASNQLQSMIEQGGLETLYSLATDDFFGSGGLGIPNEVLKDPSRREEVENMVRDQFLEVLESQANGGAKAKAARTAAAYAANGGNSGGGGSYYESAVNDYIRDILPNAAMGSVRDVRSTWERSGVLGTYHTLEYDKKDGGYFIRNGSGSQWDVGTTPQDNPSEFIAILQRNGINKKK